MSFTRSLTLLICWMVLATSTGWAQSTIGIVTSVAGNGNLGYGGDGGPAIAAQLFTPIGVAIDRAGNLYIADDLNYRVRKVSPSGVITTIAGTGIRGFSGDGAPAVAAQLSNVFGLALDPAGNLFVVDFGNGRIRKIAPDGIITTVAGTGPTEPYLFSQDGDGGPATAAQIHAPHGIAADAAGNLFITEIDNNRVRKVDSNGIITTLASGLNSPQGVAVDAAGNVFIAERANNRVLKLTPDGVMTIYAGTGKPSFSGDGGPAQAADLISPQALAVDASGNLFIACSGFVGTGRGGITFSDMRVRKVDAAGVITTAAHQGLDNNLSGIAVDEAGRLFVSGNNRVLKVTQVVPLTITVPSALPSATVDMTYSQTFQAGGGMQPYDWTIASGTLPPGISLDSATGTLSGTPTGTAGSFDFTLRVTDSLGIAVSQAVKMSINPLSFGIADGGGVSLKTQNTTPEIRVGYGLVRPNTGSTTPSGMAIFGFRENNVLVTEAAVPASPLIQGGRIYAEVDGPINTGLAIVNPNGSAATVTFFLTDANGNDFGQGRAVIEAGGQIARFLTEAPFSIGRSIHGTMTFTSSQPIGAVALRGFTNERSEFLITTLPVAPLGTAPRHTISFPHFADGLGWTSQIVLVNPTDTVMGGTLQFYGQGSAATAGQIVPLTVNGQSSTTFTYSIPPRSAASFQTSGTGVALQSGSVRVSPDNASNTPTGLLIFSYVNGGITVTQAGVPAMQESSEFRLYAETSGNLAGSIQTGIAIANPSSASVAVNLELMTLAGISTGLRATIKIPAQGQTAMFLNQIPGFASVPNPFQGVLQISTSSSFPLTSLPISVIGLRGRYNERADFLLTTTPPVSTSGAISTADLFIPQLVDGGGYTTQLILFSGLRGLSSSGVMRLFTQSGEILNLTLQ